MTAITFIVDCMPDRFKFELGQLRHTAEAAPIR